MIYGVDVSDWQGPPHVAAAPNWQKALAAGVSFASIKATEGSGWTSVTYKNDMAAATAAGIPFLMAMHFLWPGEGAAQADHFVSIVGDPNRLGAVHLDIEKNGTGTWPAFADIDAFIARLIDAHGYKRPGFIYTGDWFWASRTYLGNPTAPWGWPLWDSRYSYVPVGLSLQAGATLVPAAAWTPGYGGWKTSTIFQFTDAAVVPGITGRVDGDACSGSLSDLRAAVGLLPDTSTAPLGGDMPIYSRGGTWLADVPADTPYYTEQGDTMPRAHNKEAFTGYLTAFSVDGKRVAVDGEYAGAWKSTPQQLGWFDYALLKNVRRLPLADPTLSAQLQAADDALTAAKAAALNVVAARTAEDSAHDALDAAIAQLPH